MRSRVTLLEMREGPAIVVMVELPLDVTAKHAVAAIECIIEALAAPDAPWVNLPDLA